VKKLLFLVVLALVSVGPSLANSVPEASKPIEAYVADYIERWKAFYPSRALSQGFLDSINGYESYTGDSIDDWLDYNGQMLRLLETIETTRLAIDPRIDLRLLRTQVLKERDRWEKDRPHETSLGLYADLIGRAFEPIVSSTTLSRDEKRNLSLRRLGQVQRLAEAGRDHLDRGRRGATLRAIDELEKSASGLAEMIAPLLHEDDRLAAELEERGDQTAAAITELVRFSRDELLPLATLPEGPILGFFNDTATTEIYTDSDLTPERLEEMALGEIEASKRALAELSASYWRETYPDEPLPSDRALLIARGFNDLEANRPENEAEYLVELRQYAREVEDFVREHEIATVPERNTLSVELAPESSGPMARIGFVRSAPSFHPNPWTTWYLATIPDSHPEQERIDFWRSFNYSFKRFIVIHELYPGHYMQLKLLRENPHPVRILFPYRPFIEGWATFTERIVLDAGYAEGDYLTRLAQLRKRLENANRAYMSVQAHCNGWTEEQVTAFSIDTSLLAPQFAKSLWGRLMRSPMQILTYMLMGLELRELYEAERERLGDRFVTRHFMDAVLRTGPVPSDALVEVLRAEPPASL
jgi:hypothetical protein